MLNVCDPCLIVITRCPRRLSSAARRTVTVVLPCFFVPTIASIGGRGISLRERELARGVHVQEDPHWIEERDHAPVAAVQRPLDRSDARWGVPRAERLDAALRVALRDRRVASS